jgi:hypothetical protein
VPVNRVLPPTCTLAEVGEIVTGEGVPLIETEAFAVALLSAVATAVTVTVGGVGMNGGAVKFPFLSIVPNGVLPSRGLTPPGNPFTSQPTVVRLVLITVAVKAWVVPVVTVMDDGDTLTATRAREPPLNGAAPTPPQLTRTSVMLSDIATIRTGRTFFNMEELQSAPWLCAGKYLTVLRLVIMVLVIMVRPKRLLT